MRQDKTVARILLMFSIANVVLAAPVLIRQRRLVTDRADNRDEPIGQPEQDPAGPVHPATPPPPAGPDTSSDRWSISLDELDGLLAKSPENSAPNSPSGLHQGSKPSTGAPPLSELENSWLQGLSQDHPNQYEGSLHSVWRPLARPATLEAGDSLHKMLSPPQPSKLENSWLQDPSQDRPNQYEGSLHSVLRPLARPATLEAGDSLHKMLSPPQPSKLENSWLQDPSRDRPNQYEGSLHSVLRPLARPATLEAGDSLHKMLSSPQPSKLENSWLQYPSQDRPNQYEGSLHSVLRPLARPATLEAGDSLHKMLSSPQPSELKHSWLTDLSRDPLNQYQWWLKRPPITLTAWDDPSRVLLPPELENRPVQIHPAWPETSEAHPFDDALWQVGSVTVKDMDQASTMSWDSDHSEWEEDAAQVADETHIHP